MSSTNITQGDKRIDAESERQSCDHNIEEQPTTSGINTQFNIKVTTVGKNSQKLLIHSNSLDSLYELIRFEESHNQEAGNVKTESKSLDDLSERLKQLQNKDPTGFTRSKSFNENILKEQEKFKDSYVTSNVCQKEKNIIKDIPTSFSQENRIQNVIIVRSGYTNQPLPPHPYSYQYTQRPQRVSYQAEQIPVYQPQNMGYGMGITPDASRTPVYRRGDIDVENLFHTKEIRNKFIRKVYMILAAQLLFTFGLITFCIYEKNTREFVKRQWLLMIYSMIVIFFLMIILFCYTTARRTYPINFILLSLLTLCIAYTMAAVSCFYETKVVMISMGATAGICTLMSILACQHWFDITDWGLILCMAFLIILIYGFFAFIITMITGSNIAFLIYACLITVIFSMYLMYDTQQILGGRRIEISPEEYILGAITLYVDIMIIFHHIMLFATHCRC